MYILFNGNRQSIFINKVKYIDIEDKWIFLNNIKERLQLRESNNLEYNSATATFNSYIIKENYCEFKICNIGKTLYSDYIYFWESTGIRDITHIEDLKPFTKLEFIVELLPINERYENVKEYKVTFNLLI